jgi:hypothetical protein
MQHNKNCAFCRNIRAVLGLLYYELTKIYANGKMLLKYENVLNPEKGTVP